MVPGDPAQEAQSQAAGIAAAGVTEVEDCSGSGSGSGFGFCAYRYTGPAGDLSVVTVDGGGLPRVSPYSVNCQPG